MPMPSGVTPVVQSASSPYLLLFSLADPLP